MVYLVYGEQFPLVSKRVKKLINSILKDGIDEFNYIRINAKETLVQDIAYECSLVPFMGNKVIRIDNPYFLDSSKERVSIEKEQDYQELIKYINNPNELVDVIFVLENKNVNKKNEIYKLIEKKGKVIFEEGLSLDTLSQTGRIYFLKKGVDIKEEALNLLLERTGDNVSLFIQEAEKLSLYSKEINVDDVKALVPIPLEQNAFSICDNLISGQTTSALKIYRDMLTLKEEPVRLIALLASQFRLYCQISYLYTIEKNNQEDIAALLKIHPYRVKLMCRNLIKITYYQLLNVIDSLFNLDLKIKSMEIEPSLGLELFIINFSDMKEKKKWWMEYY